MGKHNQVSLEEEKEIIRRFTELEQRPVRIAADLNRGVPTIYRVLASNNIDVPTIRAGYTDKPSIAQRNKALALLFQGKSIEAVAKITKLNVRYIVPLKQKTDIIERAVKDHKTTQEIARELKITSQKVAITLKEAGYEQVRVWRRTKG